MPSGFKIPEISVIVAVHNVSGQIAEAIASLRAQSFVDFEALVIDDGSTDGSGEVAARAWGDDPRFTLIRQENRGLSGVRNTGLEAARGRFIAFLDGDDAFAPGFLAALHEAIQRDGADWAACAIMLAYPDGVQHPHAAIHAENGLGASRGLALQDARAVARIFPSAWNKLYRRAALGDLRFAEGTWFEDHEFFWACAVRCPVLSYVPEPLYIHRRDRVGQITGTDSERVFEQFAVLERLRPVVTGFAHGADGFAQLASRLVHERAQVIRDRPRRARFIAEAVARFKAWGVRYDPTPDPTISRALGQVMQGQVPLSVVVIAPEGGTEGLAQTLEALARQSMVDFDLHVLAPEAVVLPALLPGGAEVQRLPSDCAILDDLSGYLRGMSLVFYTAGERPTADGLWWLTNLIVTEGVAMAFGGFERDTGGYHDGWTDNTALGRDLADLAGQGEALVLRPDQALRLYPALGNRILRRDGLDPHLPLPLDAPGVQAYVLATGLAAARVGYIRLPVAQVADAPPGLASLKDLADWAAALPDGPFPGLPRGWRGTLFLRLARYQGGLDAPLWHGARTLGWAWRAGLLRLSEAARPDPETRRMVRRWLRIWRLRQG